jgi:hypothetical protein
VSFVHIFAFAKVGAISPTGDAGSTVDMLPTIQKHRFEGNPVADAAHDIFEKRASRRRKVMFLVRSVVDFPRRKVFWNANLKVLQRDLSTLLVSFRVSASEIHWLDHLYTEVKRQSGKVLLR